MSLRFITAPVLSMVCLVAPAWADFQAGLDADTHGDYATALREWRPLAEQGDVRAQASLGVLYDNGRGVPQDYAKARHWFEKAADQGLAVAQYGLGKLYSDGRGVQRDYTKARQ